MSSTTSSPEPGPLVLRPVEPGDAHRGLIAALEALSPVDLSPDELFRRILCRSSQAPLTFVATDGPQGPVVGTASVYFERKLIHQCGLAAHVEDVAVRPEWQKKGVGRALVQHVLAECRRRGAYKAVLTADDGVRPFYASLGFAEIDNGMRFDFSE